VLETGSIRRIGGTEYIKVDVRVIAATNKDLQAMVERNEFRQDLYYRFSAFPVTIPSLRERPDDIPALAEHFLSRTEDGDRHLPLSPDVIETLMSHDYPGNVRELRNVLERAAILAYGQVMCPEHVVFETARAPREPGNLPPRRRRLIERRGCRFSDDEIITALQRCDGHRARAAELLGVSERTLYRYVQKLRAKLPPELAAEFAEE